MMQEIPPNEAADLRQAVQTFITGGGGDFEDLILRVHAYQRKACAPYASYCAAFRQAESWDQIPPLPLSAFRHAEIRCFPPDESVRVFHTSGTTGEGYGCHFFQSLDLYRTAALVGWQRTPLRNLPVIALMPPPEEAPHSSLSCMAGWLTESFYWRREDALIRALAEARAPLVLFGTALALLDLAEKLGSRQLPLPEGSLLVETGGYKGSQRSLSKEDLHNWLGEKFRLRPENLWNEYGMTELSSQFYAPGVGAPHVSGPWIRARVIDPATGGEVEDGNTGVLHLFDLANVDSCCALQTRDLAVRRGRDFLLIGRDPAALPRGCSRRAEEILMR